MNRCHKFASEGIIEYNSMGHESLDVDAESIQDPTLKVANSNADDPRSSNQTAHHSG